MNFFLYGHNGSGNHGCEAIVRGTYEILRQDDQKLNITLATGNKIEDEKYRLNEIVKLIEEKNKTRKFSLPYIKAYLSLKLLKNDRLSEELIYRKTFNSVTSDMVALSIGGDNYCYPGYQRFMMLHEMLYRRGIKTILWGCSVEPSKIDKEMANDLCKYDLIVARESITYEALKKIGAKVYLYPDPAFQLKAESVKLPANFIEKEIVGINISPMIINNETKKGITFENYIHLIEYIIENTDLNILLIPHVIWEDNNDDRIPLTKLYNKFKHTNRIYMLEDMNCQQLKGYISKCKYFVGARTHSTIAAYSTCVPTLVVGYSVKARGIAKDIFGTDKNFVIPVQSLSSEYSLVVGFQFLLNNEQNIKCLQRKYLENIPNISVFLNDIKSFGII